MDTKSFVASAFANSDAAYLESCLAQRNPGQGGAGSRFLSPVTLEELQRAAWEEYAHPAVMAGCRAFRAPIAGRIGIVRLSSLAPETEVTLDDRKSIGKVEAVVKGVLGSEVDFTVLLTGPREGTEGFEVWTFFPGEPINPSQVETTHYPHGTTVTAAEALTLGLEWAKIG